MVLGPCNFGHLSQTVPMPASSQLFGSLFVLLLQIRCYHAISACAALCPHRQSARNSFFSITWCEHPDEAPSAFDAHCRASVQAPGPASSLALSMTKIPLREPGEVFGRGSSIGRGSVNTTLVECVKRLEKIPPHRYSIAQCLPGETGKLHVSRNLRPTPKESAIGPVNAGATIRWKPGRQRQRCIRAASLRHSVRKHPCTPRGAGLLSTA
jgi:hypothetical protein